MYIETWNLQKKTRKNSCPQKYTISQYSLCFHICLYSNDTLFINLQLAWVKKKSQKNNSHKIPPCWFKLLLCVFYCNHEINTCYHIINYCLRKTHILLIISSGRWYFCVRFLQVCNPIWRKNTSVLIIFCKKYTCDY